MIHPLASGPEPEDDPAASRFAEGQPVTQADVSFAYRLFMGREAETEAVTRERAGQTAAAMVHGFVGSSEFVGWVDATLADTGSAPQSLRDPCPADLLSWAVRFFDIQGAAATKARTAGTALALLATVLDIPWVAAEVPDGRGLTLASAFHALCAPGDEPEGGTRAIDVKNLYLLLLDRPPESPRVAAARPEQPLLATAMSFLTSHEFGANVVTPALAGQAARRVTLSPALRDWMHDAFGIALAEYASRAEAIAALIAQPAVVQALTEAGVAWDADAVSAALFRIGGGTAGHGEGPPSESFRTLVEASGLFDIDWYLAHNADVRRTGADPLDHFVHCGAAEGRDPGAGFEAAFYVERYPEVLEADMPLFEHYLRIGRDAGFEAKGPGPFERWLARYDELTAQDRERIEDDAAMYPLPRVICVHVPGGGAAAAETWRTAIAEQVGVTPDVQRVAETDEAGAASAMLRDAVDGTVVLLSAGAAVLRPHACYAFARELVRADASAAYCDHDHVDLDGTRGRPVFKPAMSPDLMAQLPYAGPVAAFRLGADNRERLAAAVERGAGHDPADTIAQLLLAAPPERVVRVPLPLFSLLEDDVDRPYDPHGEVFEPRPQRADRHVAPPLPDPAPRVCLLIPTRDRWQLVRDCVDSVFALSDYPRDRLEIVVIDNDSRDPDSVAYLERLAGKPGSAVVPSPGAFNFAKICNDGAAATQADVLIFLNNDTTVIRPDWLRVLAGDAMRPEIGAVGAQLLYPDDTVQHGGVVLGLMGVGGHRLIGAPVDEAAELDLTREMTAVTGACLALRRAVFDEVGGFDEALGVAFNDVDLCVRVHEAGYRNLYVAQPLLYHHESKSRGFDDTRAKVRRNMREAIYARSRYNDYFRNDPSYTPNLSLQRLGELAQPPRVMRPWRRSGDKRRVLLLSVGHGLGHGVGAVVAEQARVLRAQGWTVIVGGPVARGDRPYPGCRRVRLATEQEAAAFAVAEGVDAVIAHTPPFFSVPRYLGHRPLFYVYDHGEPPPELFADAEHRENVDWEKRFCAPLARRVFAISQAVHEQQFRDDAVVLRNGNSHLASWSPGWAARRAEIRRRLGFEGQFVVLNVCRFHEAERAYKGVDDYVTMADEARYVVPGLVGRARFVLAGRGDPHDVAVVEKAGLTVFPNLSDGELAELYAAADFYVSLSRWEGYNLGIGQALAMGLDAIASDIPAHREFDIPVAGTQPLLCRLLGDAFARWDESARGRSPRIDDWDVPFTRLAEILAEDVAEDLAGPWL